MPWRYSPSTITGSTICSARARTATAPRSSSAAADKALVSRIIYQGSFLENHCQTSRSICSNASSTRLSIRLRSLCRCLSLPTCFIQGFSWDVVFSFSWTASVTSWRRGIPRWAAADFARRNKKSGISRVVFTLPYYHIYGRTLKLSAFDKVGAWILGRNMFGPVRGPWATTTKGDSWNGWWGDNPPYHTPVFVLTHHARPPLAMEGGTTFHFVTDGLESALKQAKEAAGAKNKNKNKDV